MKIYGNISDETMAAHEWVTLDDHLGAIEAEIAKQIVLEAELREAKQECERMGAPVTDDDVCNLASDFHDGYGAEGMNNFLASRKAAPKVQA